VTGAPATAEELSHHPDHPEFSYAPVAASAVVVAYNLTDPFSGQRVNNLVLSPRLVARLVTNTSIETFVRDRELLNLNPNVRFPSNGISRVLVRAERSAAASILTSWFSADPEARKFLDNTDTWRVGLNPPYIGYSYPRDAFELVDTDPFYLPRQGQKNIALRLFYGVSPTGTQAEPTSTRGFIGIVDLPTAKRFGLQVAGLLKPDGSVILPTDDSITRGVADADVSPSGVLVADPTPEDPLAYPMVKVDYAMVPKTFDTPAKIADVKRVLNYAVGDGQGLLPSGYVALPENMRATTRSIVAAIGAPSATTTTRAPTATTSRPRYRPSVTIAVEETTTTSSTTSTTIARTTTTEPAPITVPEPRIDGSMGATNGSSALMLGLGGLSGAAILGTAPWRRWADRRKKAKS
jgi:ABC-type phosphate transport system substrate-binding protein